MSDLIARLEAATEGSRELSDEVLLALVPEGWAAILYTETGTCEIYQKRARKGIEHRIDGKALSCSLCAAILRARETDHG